MSGSKKIIVDLDAEYQDSIDGIVDSEVKDVSEDFIVGEIRGARQIKDFIDYVTSRSNK